MLIIKKTLIIALVLALKVIALPLYIIAQAVLLLTGSCEAVVKVVLGLFNLLLGIMIFYFIGTHNVEMLQQTGIFFIIEAVGMTLFMLAEGTIGLVMEVLKEVILFNPFSRVKN